MNWNLNEIFVNLTEHLSIPNTEVGPEEVQFTMILLYMCNCLLVHEHFSNINIANGILYVYVYSNGVYIFVYL